MQMFLWSRKFIRSSPWPYLRVSWAVAILIFCIILQIVLLLVARQVLGKNEGVILALVLGLILPTLIIVARISPTPRATLRLKSISLPSACWVVGAALCFTLLATSSVELILRAGWLPSEIQVLLEEEERLLRELFSLENAGDIFTMALSVVVVAPIAEELLFRGLLQGSLEKRLGNWIGLLAAGLAFGVLHGRLRFLPVSLLGVLMGYMTMRTNSVISGILAHSGNNALALGLAFSTRPEFLSLTSLAGGVALGGLGLAVFLRLFQKSTRGAMRISKTAHDSSPNHGLPFHGLEISVHTGRPKSGGGI
jgi:membrane protease YdiL (CAAX protease family)